MYPKPRPEKEILIQLSAQGNDKQVETRLTQPANDKGATHRELRKKENAVPEKSKERQSIEQEMAAIVDWLRTAPDAEGVVVRIVQ